MKKIKKILYWLFIRLHEKKYNCGYKKIKYLFFKQKNSDKLIVIFSAFPGEGNGSSKYNYIKSLKKVYDKKLYILDDFGFKKVGSYYLGENGNLDLGQYIIKLINDIKEKNKIKKIYVVGSSKGGTAAVYFGTLLEADMIIAGAPQYYIGNYLLSDEYNKKILFGILGREYTKNDISMLNNLVKNSIFGSSSITTRYIINYSKNEHTYDEHIKYLINDLKKAKRNVVLEEGNYGNHSDVGNEMPKLFKKYLKMK